MGIKKMAKKLSIAILLAILLFSWNSLFATDFSSTNFIIKDPVIEPGAGFSTSNNFQLWGSMGQAAIGTSTATSFGLKSGFMYFLSSPTAPSGLNAVAASQTQINLSWTDNSSNEDGFKIERKTGSGGTYSQIATVLINVASYSDTGLSASTNYYYRVRAYNSAGNSGYSNEANATTLSPSAPLVGGGGGDRGDGRAVCRQRHGGQAGALHLETVEHFRSKMLGIAGRAAIATAQHLALGQQALHHPFRGDGDRLGEQIQRLQLDMGAVGEMVANAGN